MMKNLTQINYTTTTASYQLFLPLDVEVLIPENDLVRLLNKIMEELDYTQLERSYSKKGRKPAVTPKMLFKIMVYGYANKIYSSRGIEEACKRDINFMWLLEGNKAPDHNTFARFRNERCKKSIENLFYQLISRLKNYGEIKLENLFIDGTKIEANANKYSFVWKKSTIKYHNKINIQISEKIKEIEKTLKKEYSPGVEIEEILRDLENKKERENISFVYGRGKRKTNIQRYIEDLKNYLTRKNKYSKYEEILQERNSFSKTDHDATFMRMKDDHMGNGQLKAGYNLQIGVEAEYIVGIDISQERSDSLTLIPLMKKLENNLGEKPKNIIADAGYESEENYTYLENQEQKYYIKPTNYEKSKTRKYRADKFKRENMDYCKQRDEYTCPNQKKLKNIGNKYRISKSGYKSNVNIYECEDCSNCLDKNKCTAALGNRKISVSKKFQLQRERSQKNITSELGILLRTNRSIQVEGVFGVLKEDYRFRRFFLRGKVNVLTETLFLGIAYNISKFHNKIQNNRCGMQLHKKVAA